MEKMELHILGCGSAKPTVRHAPASQVLNVRDKLFMIDCGEGAQVQFCKSHLKFSRLHSVFISHLHGDHWLGLPGLISTMNLLGRTAQLHIYSPPGLKKFVKPLLDFLNGDMGYEVLFHEFKAGSRELIYEDRCLTVTTIPLTHRIACCGFLFREKPLPNHIRREMIDAYEIPLSQINSIKNGASYQLPSGEWIENSRLTRPADPPRSYAYCSDTVFMPGLAQEVRGVNVLYHEATFANEDSLRARQTFHSTAEQAATVARDAGVKRLIIGHYSARYTDENVLLEQALPMFPATTPAREGLCVRIE